MFEIERAEKLSAAIDQISKNQKTEELDSPEDHQIIDIANKLLSDPPFQPTLTQDQKLQNNLAQIALKANPQQARKEQFRRQRLFVLKTIGASIFLLAFTLGLFLLFREVVSKPFNQFPQPAGIATATTQPVIIPQALKVVSAVCKLNAADTFLDENMVYPEIPQAFIGGGRVESGDFKFDLWLGCDERYNNDTPSTPDTFSEINGLGVFSAYSYNGPEQDGTLWDYAGFEPFIRQSSGVSPIGSGMQSFVIRGLQFSNDIIPDFTQQDTRLRYVYFAELPDGNRYGAALAFTLQRELEGYRPVDIDVTTLSAEELVNIENQEQSNLPFAIRNPIEDFTNLNTIRQRLEDWQNALISPAGWLYTHTAIEDHGNNTLYGDITNYINENWYYLDNNGRAIMSISQTSQPDGSILQQSVYANGLGRNLTFGTTYENDPVKLNFIKDLIETLTSQARSENNIYPQEVEWQGRNSWMFVSRDSFDEPVNLDNNGLVSAIESRKYIDLQTGERLGEETIITTTDGQEELQRRIINVSFTRIDSPSDTILALLQQPVGPYIPPEVEGTPVPAGFDPSSQKLRLISYPGDDFELPSFWVGDIYAGEYLLGRVNFGGVPGGRCQRSQNGSLIAYLFEMHSNTQPYSSQVKWLNLSDLTTIYQPPVDLKIISMSISWSPVQSVFAFNACLTDDSNCGLYLLDTETNTVRLVTTVAVSGWPIIWKPDGSQIALIDTRDNHHQLYVVNVNTGETVYQGIFDADAWQVPADSPVVAWGSDFPHSLDEQSNCFMK